nr:hypothetical protein Q903MT_gene2718 [Picea sitchensis]
MATTVRANSGLHSCPESVRSSCIRIWIMKNKVLTQSAQIERLGLMRYVSNAKIALASVYSVAIIIFHLRCTKSRSLLF